MFPEVVIRTSCPDAELAPYLRRVIESCVAEWSQRPSSKHLMLMLAFLFLRTAEAEGVSVDLPMTAGEIRAVLEEPSQKRIDAASTTLSKASTSNAGSVANLVDGGPPRSTPDDPTRLRELASRGTGYAARLLQQYAQGQAQRSRHQQAQCQRQSLVFKFNSQLIESMSTHRPAFFSQPHD